MSFLVRFSIQSHFSSNTINFTSHVNLPWNLEVHLLRQPVVGNWALDNHLLWMQTKKHYLPGPLPLKFKKWTRFFPSLKWFWKKSIIFYVISKDAIKSRIMAYNVRCIRVIRNKLNRNKENTHFHISPRYKYIFYIRHI